MQEAMNEIGIAPYIINLVQPFMSAEFFPCITFLVVAALNFSTGSVWGIPAIVVPVILPLAVSLDANLLVVMGALLDIWSSIRQPRLLLLRRHRSYLQLL